MRKFNSRSNKDTQGVPAEPSAPPESFVWANFSEAQLDTQVYTIEYELQGAISARIRSRSLVLAGSRGRGK